MENKYTARDFYLAIAHNAITEQEIAYANAALGKLDERNAKRKEAPKKVDPEKLALREKIVAFITAHAMCDREEIAEACDVSPATVTPNCTLLVGQGIIKSEKVKRTRIADGKQKTVEKTVYSKA